MSPCFDTASNNKQQKKRNKIKENIHHMAPQKYRAIIWPTATDSVTVELESCKKWLLAALHKYE